VLRTKAYLLCAILVTAGVALAWGGAQGSGGNQAPYELRVTRGEIPGTAFVLKFGFNPQIDTTTDPEDVWATGGLMTFPTTAAVVSVVSTDSADDDGGTGANTVTLYGVDENWDEQSETVTLNGTTPVSTSGTHFRVYRAFVATAGSGSKNAGAISFTTSDALHTLCTISAEEGQTTTSLYTVARNKTAYLTNLYATIHRNGQTAGSMAELEFRLRTNLESTPVERVQLVGGVAVDGSSVGRFDVNLPTPFVGPCDLYWECNEVTDNGSKIGVGYELIVSDS